ncbi:MAG TPA: FAD-dependent oxidoreductase, partial [Hydrogenophaga sp.]|nr:FAD-dependent oxidoreductase [Hydrogenophaga sp.]
SLVRPAALVHAWLDEATRLGHLTAHWNQTVAHLRRIHSDTDAQDRAATGSRFWQAVAADGSTLAEAPVVVVCAAFGSLPLLTGSGVELPMSVLPLRPVKGQMSLAELTGEPLADRPQRDNGVFVPRYEDAGLAPAWPKPIWAMGSTYVRGDTSTDITAGGHERNAQSLEAMNPQAAERLRDAAGAQKLKGWAGVRCASLDRLPLVGALPDNNALLQLKNSRRRYLPSLADTPRQPGLYMLSAMGSRGITLAHWCARLLTSQIQGESFDAELDLIAAIDPARFAWRQARRSSA